MIDSKVLFVEDSPTVRRIILNTLKRIGISDIIEAENGNDALRKLGDQEIGLVLNKFDLLNG